MKNKEKKQVSENEWRLVERLRKQPEIREQIEGMLEEVEDAQERVESADQVEEMFVERVREMGRLGVERWAQNKAGRSAAQKPESGARRGGKKKSDG
jgi:C-terminal processing protease CtpA/Prc